MPAKRFIQTALMFLCLTAVAASGSDFNKGLQHMEEGDYAMAYCLWEPLARHGHPDAQYHLGWLFANGNGLNVDVRTAVYWWQQAAGNGYLDAQFSLGLAYTTGEGIEADSNEAFKWFFAAANSGHQDAKDIVKRLVLESGKNYYEQFPQLKKIDWLKQSVIVKNDTVNLRAGPGTTFKIVQTANKGEELVAIAQQDEWLEVLLDEQNGATAWVFSSLVNKQ